jgi:hypothetical protein
MPPGLTKEELQNLKYWVADELLVNVRAGNMPQIDNDLFHKLLDQKLTDYKIMNKDSKIA